ncbi:hypothetical protein D7X87_18235 [bacterium D16-54]|nr:hypothetical protein D7X87_18235 [bacterium D16-54]RKJ13087.1 hypothetical protein D7X65_18070 [bacterium D16-56]
MPQTPRPVPRAITRVCKVVIFTKLCIHCIINTQKNRLGIVRDISFYNKHFLDSHPDIITGKKSDSPAIFCIHTLIKTYDFDIALSKHTTKTLKPDKIPGHNTGIPSVLHILIMGTTKIAEIIIETRILAILKKSRKLLMTIPFFKKPETVIAKIQTKRTTPHTQYTHPILHLFTWDAKNPLGKFLCL